LLYGSRGADVVVNDFNKEAAQKVVGEINAGARWFPFFVVLRTYPTFCLTSVNNVGGVGRAVVNSSSVTDGSAVIKTALDAFGGVTILINNAGILRDKGFGIVFNTLAAPDHVRRLGLRTCPTRNGIKSRMCTLKARSPAPTLPGQSSASRNLVGLLIPPAPQACSVSLGYEYCLWCFCSLTPVGNFGQANYSAAKMGLVGFTKTLALEGAKYNIKANAIAPVGTRVEFSCPFFSSGV
jgi:multifunctional beta-oxidation protein